MFCPQCRSEYQVGFTECAFCHVPLVDELSEESERTSWDAAREEDQLTEAFVDKVEIAPESKSAGADEPIDHLELVTVLSTGDPAALAVAKSILQSVGIEFLVRGEEVQDLLGIGRFPRGLNLVAGAMQLQVPAEDAAEAGEMLSSLQ